MTSIRQFANLISARRRRIAIAALPLAVLLVLGVLASQPAHAQTNFKVLYSFRGKPAGDGSLPHATLVRDSAGNLFGTTLLGGDTNNGTVFKLDSSGRETVLHRFAAGSNGAYPLANLVLDSAGNLYGTTARGGTFSQGTVFKVEAAGNETVLHSFAGLPDSARPNGGLARDSASNLYGTTIVGGSANLGTVFKVDSNNHEAILHSFAGLGDEANPDAGLLRDSAGNLFGTTTMGGTNNMGPCSKWMHRAPRACCSASPG